MASCNTIRGIPVRFPFEPYQIQKDYMEKVIDCLQNQQNGVLESPTGTGKTLSLLCSSLAWLEIKKAQVQAQRVTFNLENHDFRDKLNSELEEATTGGGPHDNGRAFMAMPTIIYASRTHSQLSQAMQELKRSDYKHMKASVLGSREQMCINTEVKNEQNSAMKIHMCRLKVKGRSCHFYNGVERKKDDPAISDLTIMDIEDLVRLGEQHRFCPYFMSKELKQRSDIVFMPYNYLLDPKARKALGVELKNNIIILDEAHNVEKICEDSASLQMKSTDITLCIDEITAVMKALSEEIPLDFGDQDTPRDFTAEELCVLKEMLLSFEKVLDAIPLNTKAPEGTYFDGNYIFSMLEQVGITDGNHTQVTNLIDKLIQFLSTVTLNDGPFQRKGNGLQVFSDLLLISFASVNQEFKDKIQKCYKVHIAEEEPKRKNGDNWLSRATNARGRTLSYWCFSPGFGMNMLMGQGIHCVILTSGTLAPLRPLISELELEVKVRIENPHIVGGDQVCVKILTKGPDNEPLNSNFQNRSNPKYIQSLGMVILNLIRSIPDGVLIFFPSYPIMHKCQESWQESGLWSGINQQKAVFVEPKNKDAFNEAMTSYYSKVRDPALKGAIFMGVCRGKVSEGLDFADANGRAVFITGLPYPPLKDPRIILKKRYLDTCNQTNKEFLRGDEWYSLEATRAINQAVGRVIRHRYDYGAIILLDSRFNNPKIKANMSKWLQGHIKVAQNFREISCELREFFKNAQKNLPSPKLKPLKSELCVPAEFDVPSAYKSGGAFDFSTSSCSSSSDDGLVNLHKRKNSQLENPSKKTRFTVVANAPAETTIKTTTLDFINMLKKTLDGDTFKQFLSAMSGYRERTDFAELQTCLDAIFLSRHHLRYIIKGLSPYVRPHHKDQFREYCEKMDC